VTKWLLVPIGLGTAGYYLLGPHIGNSPTISRFVDKTLGGKSEHRVATYVEPEADKPAIEAQTMEEPEVEVSVQRSSRRSWSDEPARPRRTRRKRPSQKRPEPPVSITDEAPAPEPEPQPEDAPAATEDGP
jgi:hypothetical protein